MQLAIEQFRLSLARVRDLIAIHNSLKSQTTSALDVSDILRAALVLTVSALDYYIHEVVTLGMLEIGSSRFCVISLIDIMIDLCVLCVFVVRSTPSLLRNVS